ncbi:MAG: HEAT repeat domain-containing protein [Phycisphaeraceae bacterium]|nr:HEAT repeat domain-containing protein [Phycisphaeraceae bacterium]
MSLGRVMVGVVVAACICLAASAQPQASIPPELRATTTTFNEAQETLIETYVSAAVDQLATGEDKPVQEGRRLLLEPLAGDNSPIFRQAYSSFVRVKLTPALDSDKTLVRLNAMIIAAQLSDRGALELVKKGLADSNPAVRYRAAKAAGQLLVNVPFDTNTGREAFEKELLAIIKDRISQETSNDVWRPLLDALAGLQLPEGTSELVDALNRRIQAHATQPALTLDSERRALRGLFVKVVQGADPIGSGRQIDRQLIRNLAKVSFRYLEMCATTLNNPSSAADAVSFQGMIQDADVVLRWSVQKLNATPIALKPIDPLVKESLWAEILLQTQQWRELLTKSPFSFEPAELSIPTTPPAEPDAAS